MAKLDEIEKRLADTQARLKQLQAEKRKIEARAQEAERRKDTRRKILIGAALTAEWQPDQVRMLVAKHLKRDDDRALFGLSPLPKAGEHQQAA